MQPDLFPTKEPITHQLTDGYIVETQGLFSPVESNSYFEQLAAIIPWSQSDIRIAGKLIPIPRLQCWIADPALKYTYSGVSMVPEPWLEPVLEIKSIVERVSGFSFNSALANYYRDGNDSVAWHSDDEPELGLNPTVASVSFGAVRPFELKHKFRLDLTKIRLMVQGGSLLLMGGTIQNNWLHQIPKVRSLKEPRINLTFRSIIN